VQGMVVLSGLLLILVAGTHAEHSIFDDGSGIGYPGPLRPQRSLYARRLGIQAPKLRRADVSDIWVGPQDARPV
jgi:hypothetical protein